MAPAHQHNPDPLVGKVIDDRYQILERIGEGGMGVVYKARQSPIDRIVAIKMLNAQMAQDANWVQRFNNEARACSQLQHPNTISMFEFGQTRDGQPFMAMEFLDGQSLREAIAHSAPMPPARVVKILIQCCASLAEAHSVSIIHRDIKPDNVFLLSMAGSPDFVKLLDFSVAKLLQDDRMRTQAGVVFGTPQYMSPEQGRGLPLDARADLYSLGILSYEMLTGQVPFNNENPMVVLQMHIRQGLPPLPQSVPPNVAQLVYRALEKDPSRRHQSAGEMMQHCQQLFNQLGGQSSGFALGQPGGMTPPPMGFGPGPGGQLPPMGGGMQMSGPQMGGAAQMGRPPGGPPPQQGPGPGGMAVADPGAKTVVAGQAPAGLQELLRKQAPADAKTIIAGVNAPEIPGRPPPSGGPGGGPGAAGAKTMIAGPQGGMPPGMPQGGPPGMPDPAAEGPPKTIMLQDSEGVVSFSQGQSGPMQGQHGPGGSGYHAALDQGGEVTPLYWAVCLATGLVVGVLAYLLVIQLS